MLSDKALQAMKQIVNKITSASVSERCLIAMVTDLFTHIDHTEILHNNIVQQLKDELKRGISTHTARRIVKEANDAASQAGDFSS